MHNAVRLWNPLPYDVMVIVHGSKNDQPNLG